MNIRVLHWGLAVTCIALSILCSIGASGAVGWVWLVMSTAGGVFSFVAGVNIGMATGLARRFTRGS